MPAIHPFHIMTKPIGPICNLDCQYCYYLEKEALYTEGKWRMSEDVLRNYIRQYIEAQPTDKVSFAWQGGEPTLLGVDFFKQVVALQKEYTNGKLIENALQTNGTLMDSEWAQFLKENAFLVGVSIDGPRELHDHYRVDKLGQSSFREVMRGIDVLKKHEVCFNTLTCLNRVTAQKPIEIYRFLKGIGSEFMQFIPVVERKPDKQARDWGLKLAGPDDLSEADDKDLPIQKWSVRPKDFGMFYMKVFDRWIRKDVGKVYVQLFETALAKWLQIPGGICVHEETCGKALALEHNGDLYSCDHFVYPGYRLGNLAHTPLSVLADSPRQKVFGNDKRDKLPRYCRECEVRFACNGGCPKERFIRPPEGEPGLNYLCAAYREFFNHITPVMQGLASLLQNRREPATIMSMIRDKAIPGYRPVKG